jgi:hypothetical protein
MASFEATLLCLIKRVTVTKIGNTNQEFFDIKDKISITKPIKIKLILDLTKKRKRTLKKKTKTILLLGTLEKNIKPGDVAIKKPTNSQNLGLLLNIFEA